MPNQKHAKPNGQTSAENNQDFRYFLIQEFFGSWENPPEFWEDILRLLGRENVSNLWSAWKAGAEYAHAKRK